MKSRNKKKQKQLIKKSQELVKQSHQSNSSNEVLHTNESTNGVQSSDSTDSTEEELSCFYVDPITGEIQTISMEQDKFLYEEKAKARYLEEYGISERAFLLTQEFFQEFKDDYYLCIGFLKRVIEAAVSRRTDVHVSVADINRMLDTLDTDGDGKINLREFFQLLIFFLSNESTLKKRITGALQEQSYSHETEGYLAIDEARQFTNFLYTFYGISEAHLKTDFINNLYHSSANHMVQPYKIDYEEVTYGHYAQGVYAHLNECCFVS